jgi:hypothetical protein
VVPKVLTKSTRFRHIIGLSSHCIRLRETIETGLPMCFQEKVGTVKHLTANSAFSPFRLVEQVSREMGIFRVFRGKERRNFSAVRT